MAAPRRPRIYIAGPYTHGDVAVNVRAAIDAADAVMRWGTFAYCPHLSHFQHLVHPHPWEHWLQHDLAWLALCDALIRLPGESRGADLEEAEARRLGIPVFHSLHDGLDWFLHVWLERNDDPRGNHV